MTEQIAALDALIEAVEAGRIDDDSFCAPFHAKGLCREAVNAYHGSLDAAKALHEALLPGWEWRLRVNMAWVWTTPSTIQGGDEIEDDSGAGLPARAWLLAILKAYRAGL